MYEFECDEQFNLCLHLFQIQRVILFVSSVLYLTLSISYSWNLSYTSSSGFDHFWGHSNKVDARPFLSCCMKRQACFLKDKQGFSLSLCCLVVFSLHSAAQQGLTEKWVALWHIDIWVRDLFSTRCVQSARLCRHKTLDAGISVIHLWCRPQKDSFYYLAENWHQVGVGLCCWDTMQQAPVSTCHTWAASLFPCHRCRVKLQDNKKHLIPWE